MAVSNNNLERLLIDFKESLERDIQSVVSKMDLKMDALLSRFDLQAARLDRQGALLQRGSRWMAKTNEWSEKIDQSLEQNTKRIEKLEGRQKNPNA